MLSVYSDKDTKVAEILLRNGADPNILDIEGSSALDAAVDGGKRKVLPKNMLKI